MAQKTVVLGVSACIGAYKACYIVRGLQKAGLRVRVVMTQHATELVGVQTFEALTHEEVLVDMFDHEAKDPIPHISLANEADLMVIAPCTANLLAKLANPHCSFIPYLQTSSKEPPCAPTPGTSRK